MDTILLVVPCKNEERAIPLFHEEVSKAFSTIPAVAFREIFVDDGSGDGTVGVLRGLAECDDRVCYLSLSRNFGKEAALYAGLTAAVGIAGGRGGSDPSPRPAASQIASSASSPDRFFIATLDVDLQDPPSLIPEMYRSLAAGECDWAATRRVSRKGEPFLRTLGAKGFYRLMDRLSDADIEDGARDFRLMSLQFAESVLALKEHNRFSKGIYGWVGYRTKWFPYENVSRSAGESKWSFFSLARYSIEGIVGFSAAPLHLASIAGMVACACAVLGMVFVLVRAAFFGDPVPGWPSLAVLILFMGGMQLLCLGILGQYVARIFVETKDRPHCLVREVGGFLDSGSGEKGPKAGCGHEG